MAMPFNRSNSNRMVERTTPVRSLRRLGTCRVELLRSRGRIQSAARKITTRPPQFLGRFPSNVRLSGDHDRAYRSKWWAPSLGVMLPHMVNQRDITAVIDAMEQAATTSTNRPVARRGRLRSSPLVVDPHARTPCLLGFLPTNKPLVATNGAHRHTCRQFDGLSGVICWQEMGQAPASLGVSGQILGEIGRVSGLATLDGHPKAPPTAWKLCDRARPLDAMAPPSFCHHDHRRAEDHNLPKTRKDTSTLFQEVCLSGIPPPTL
jgi:hypothetical protein